MRRSDYPDYPRYSDSPDYPYRDRDPEDPRADEDYLRRPPSRKYGSNDQGYSDLPAHERNERLRHLSSRHGNPERRLPRESVRGTWGGESRRDDEEWARRYRDQPYRPSGAEASRGDYGAERETWRQEPRRYPMYGLGDPRAQEYSEYGSGRYGGSGYRRSEGPRNYRRADDRLHDAVCTRLAHEEGLDVSEVTVHVREGVVTMEGTVNDRRSKYEIEEIAESVFGVRDVVNHIHVRRFGVLASE
ncbi:BON domain-containing protein [Cupriavidus pinatubonensis]|uniref:BON domain-containing protein n=2 Tax=Cupriavidus pinatubonensis TaxID=248026 RepID=UPI001C72F77D|nr:BON domain-containing protein [Cupriavidus pinatubonensis]QYY28692.1 BON domain-containing protein [Cupriavidus pinatubonensis]